MIDKSVWLCTPKGKLVKMYYDFKKSFIKSYTRGGVAELRKWGWNIKKLSNRREK
tara:strand:+ start:70 stop:234 length:165 start_codon:yes stop_codon:yes gene_type:complete